MQRADAFQIAAVQHVANQRRPDRIPQLAPNPLHAGQNLLRVNGHIQRLERCPAVPAISAPGFVRLAKIIEQHTAQAIRRLAVIDHLLQPRQVAPVDFFVLRRGQAVVLRRMIQQLARSINVGRAVQQDALRRGTIAPGTSGLLIIRLDAHRHIVMNDVADI